MKVSLMMLNLYTILYASHLEKTSLSEESKNVINPAPIIFELSKFLLLLLRRVEAIAFGPYLCHNAEHKSLKMPWNWKRTRAAGD